MIIGMLRQFRASHTEFGTLDLGLIYIIPYLIRTPFDKHGTRAKRDIIIQDSKTILPY